MDLFLLKNKIFGIDYIKIMFNCNICQKEFPSKFNMERHKKNNACAIKLKPTTNSIGIVPSLETHIQKLNNTIREEIFKFEKTDTYCKNKDQLIEFLCEQMAGVVDTYFTEQNQDEMNRQKSIEKETQKKICINSAPQTYIKNIKKIKELETEIQDHKQNIRTVNFVEPLNRDNLNKSQKDFKLVHLYLELDDDDDEDMSEFMMDISDLTMENLDKFHKYSSGKTLNWLEAEFEKEQDVSNKKIYTVAKVYINRKFRDKFDFSKDEHYFNSQIQKLQTMIDMLEQENRNLEMSYATYTGRVIEEVIDPEYQEKLRKEEEHDRRVSQYKQANGSSASSNDCYSDSD
jgi:hypothetical protein